MADLKRVKYSEGKMGTEKSGTTEGRMYRGQMAEMRWEREREESRLYTPWMTYVIVWDMCQFVDFLPPVLEKSPYGAYI